MSNICNKILYSENRVLRVCIVILLTFCILFSSFAIVEKPVYAIAGVDDATIIIIATILAACGVSLTSENVRDFCGNVYVKMSDSIKQEIDNFKTQHESMAILGKTFTFTISNALNDWLADFLGINYNTGTSSVVLDVESNFIEVGTVLSEFNLSDVVFYDRFAWASFKSQYLSSSNYVDSLSVFPLGLTQVSKDLYFLSFDPGYDAETSYYWKAVYLTDGGYYVDNRARLFDYYSRDFDVKLVVSDVFDNLGYKVQLINVATDYVEDNFNSIYLRNSNYVLDKSLAAVSSVECAADVLSFPQQGVYEDNEDVINPSIPLTAPKTLDDIGAFTKDKVMSGTGADTNVDTATGSISSDGTGEGIFSKIGRFILDIPLLGDIIKLLGKILSAIGDLLKALLEAIAKGWTNFIEWASGLTLAGAITAILEGIQSIFVPKGFTWNDFVNKAMGIFGGTTIDFTDYVNSLSIPDVTVGGKLMGHNTSSVTIVDNSGLRKSIGTVRIWIGTFLCALGIIYNYNMFMKLMGYGSISYGDHRTSRNGGGGKEE